MKFTTHHESDNREDKHCNGVWFQQKVRLLSRVKESWKNSSQRPCEYYLSLSKFVTRITACGDHVSINRGLILAHIGVWAFTGMFYPCECHTASQQFPWFTDADQCHSLSRAVRGQGNHIAMHNVGESNDLHRVSWHANRSRILAVAGQLQRVQIVTPTVMEWSLHCSRNWCPSLDL